MLARTTPFVLYETLGPTLPDGMAGAAAVWGLAQKAFFAYPEAVQRAGHADGNALFDAILASPSGVTFTVHEYADDFALISHADHKINLDMPEMLDDIRALPGKNSQLTTADFPIVLAAGERRAYTANDIIRDPGWRKRDGDGALRVSVEDAAAARPERRCPRAHHHRRAAPPRRPSKSRRRCCPVTRHCPTASAWTTPTPTAPSRFPVSRPTR